MYHHWHITTFSKSTSFHGVSLHYKQNTIELLTGDHSCFIFVVITLLQNFAVSSQFQLLLYSFFIIGFWLCCALFDIFHIISIHIPCTVTYANEMIIPGVELDTEICFDFFFYVFHVQKV